ncbi:hypothetical protein EMCRGX_G008567 [Ephydatia muelleri]
MVANKGKGPASSKKPPTSSTKATEDGGTPTVALKTNAATTPVDIQFHKDLWGLWRHYLTYMLSVLIHECLSSQQELSGGCNIATPERDAGDCLNNGHSQEGEARDQTSLPTSPSKMERMGKSPGTTREEERQTPPPSPLQVHGPQEQVRPRETTPGFLPPSKRREATALEEAECKGCLSVLWSQCEGCVVCPLVPVQGMFECPLVPVVDEEDGEEERGLGRKYGYPTVPGEVDYRANIKLTLLISLPKHTPVDPPLTLEATPPTTLGDRTIPMAFLPTLSPRDLLITLDPYIIKHLPMVTRGPHVVTSPNGREWICCIFWFSYLVIYIYPNGLYLVLAYLCVIESFENLNLFSVLEKQSEGFRSLPSNVFGWFARPNIS